MIPSVRHPKSIRSTPRPARPKPTRKFIVAAEESGWRVSGAAYEPTTFHAREAAVSFACGLAREVALRGAVGLVVVKAAVHELHCFTPAGEVAA